MRNRLANSLFISLLLTLSVLNTTQAAAARGALDHTKNNAPANGAAANSGADKSSKEADPSPGVEDRLKALEQIIEQQQREIQALHDLIEKRDGEKASVRFGAPVSVEPPNPAVAARAPQTTASGKNENVP